MQMATRIITDSTGDYPGPIANCIDLSKLKK